MSSASLFDAFKNYMAKNYGKSHGKMLIHTGVIGWILSAAAQVMAIVTNDKISYKQKMYLIPQELADAAVNIVSFYLITQTFKSVSTKVVNCGKLLNKPVREFLEKNNIKNVGKKTFDVLRDGKLPADLTEKFESFRNGVDFIGTTAGSILSCNIVTPIIRNEIATHKQKNHIAKMEEYNISVANPARNYFEKPSIQSFQAKAYSSSLKI